MVSNRDTQETLLCAAFVFEVSNSEHGAQHHIYRLVKDWTALSAFLSGPVDRNKQLSSPGGPWTRRQQPDRGTHLLHPSHRRRTRLRQYLERDHRLLYIWHVRTLVYFTKNFLLFRTPFLRILMCCRKSIVSYKPFFVNVSIFTLFKSLW